MNIIQKIQIGSPQESHVKYVQSLINLVKNCNATGDIVELGVAKGRNSVILGNLIKMFRSKSKYFGLDTFSGYEPEDIDNDILQGIQNRKRWHNDISEINKIISKSNLSDICTLIKGDLKKTLPKLCIENSLKISILYVDCNAYKPSIEGMRIAYPFMTDNSIICIDEHRVGGETKAITEFCKEKKLKLIKTGDSIGIPMYAKISKASNDS